MIHNEKSKKIWHTQINASLRLEYDLKLTQLQNSGKNSEIEAKARVALAQKESQKELANGVKEVMGKETEEKEI